ncbi:MAG: helix-turn-helix domain-containing protein [Bacteroidetes bacterium]|nr:helix-turn-helix domain-containing protein [Bacteroidota bacterium]
MKTLIKNARLAQKLKMREVAAAIQVDAALISHWEKGSRKPTRQQLRKLAEVLSLDYRKLLIEWMSEVVLYEIKDEEWGMDALKMVQDKMKLYRKSRIQTLDQGLQGILEEIDQLKFKLDEARNIDSNRVKDALELEYTYESNRIEGNTLSLRETDLVIREGMTISGKSIREHLEAINHQDAVAYLKELAQKKTDIRERDILQLHHLVLRGIDKAWAGKYRNVHPFIDGNGRTSRLLMNLILMRSGYVIANIKGDHQNRMKYYEALDQCRDEGRKPVFHLFVAEVEKASLERYLQIIQPQVLGD